MAHPAISVPLKKSVAMMRRQQVLQLWAEDTCLRAGLVSEGALYFSFIEFQWEMSQSISMPEQLPKPNVIEDEWGTSRIGYEDRPVYQPRKTAPKRKGSPFLRSIGGLLVVGGIFWGTYLITSVGGPGALLKPGLPSRPVLACAAGLLILLLEKLIR
jgi:hypothetical protein